ncbi:hypothetical protein NDU88_002627 [Pleurodeles waltl]|uniref:Uncharacterized protein n=1 Tax=Pleurodeles waltl TaxID=8319 RepID=A0AAV7KWM4_PLEWA|nr:hypothetical protein NDU88_002627 [Pleurodeles waltl]
MRGKGGQTPAPGLEIERSRGQPSASKCLKAAQHGKIRPGASSGHSNCRQQKRLTPASTTQQVSLSFLRAPQLPGTASAGYDNRRQEQPFPTSKLPKSPQRCSDAPPWHTSATGTKTRATRHQRRQSMCKGFLEGLSSSFINTARFPQQEEHST